MNKFYRSLLVTGIVAAGLAGCGDDVTITEPPPPPPPPPPSVTGVTVAPDNVQVAPGTSVQMTAAVTSDAGCNPAITWGTSDLTRATVTATGLVAILTGAQPGAVAIRATATCAAGGGTGSGAATLNITSATANTPTVSISAVNNAAGAPALLAAIAGQINIVLNLERNGAAVQDLDLTIDTETGDSSVGKQSFTAPAAVGADGAELAIEVITFPVNTARFDSTTGLVSFRNREHSLKAKVRYGSSGQSAASNTIRFTTVNANTFQAFLTFTGTTATATSTGGLFYRRGGMNVGVLPVIYNSGSVTLANGNVSFGVSGCDASGIGVRNVTLTAPAAGSNLWLASFPQTVSAPTPAAASVQNYEMVPGCLSGTGEPPLLFGNDSNGNPIFTGITPANGGPNASGRVRLDNRAPGAPTFVANPNGRRRGWINPTVGLAGSNTSSTDDDWMLNGAPDAGVGGNTRFLRTGAATSGLVDVARAATASSSPTLPSPTLLPSDLCGIASAQDLLGNESALPAAGTTCLAPPSLPFVATGSTHLAFGVDIAPPTVQYCDVAPPLPAGCGLGASVLANDRLNGGTIGNEFRVMVIDTGSVGNSGMDVLPSSPQASAVVRRTAAGIVFPADCVQGTLDVTGTICNQSNLTLGTVPTCAGVPNCMTPSLPGIPVVSTTIAGLSVPGYYTQNSSAIDAAGNATPLGPRAIVWDNLQPALTSALFNVPLNGPTVVFSANASDNLDLRDVLYTLTYGGGPAGANPIQYPRSPINPTFNAPSLVNSNAPAGITISGFVRQLEDVTGNSPLAVSLVGGFKPITLTGLARDQAGNLSPGAPAGVTTIPGTSVTNGVSYTLTAVPQKVDSFAVRNAATLISDGAGPAAAVNPLSITLTARVRGPTATFAAPFNRIDFYVPFGGVLLQIGSATTWTTTDDGTSQGRRHDYSFAWTPGTAFGLGILNVYAIGVNSVGDGLVTPLSANITITNP